MADLYNLPSCASLEMLVAWLREDKADRLPWQPERFAQYVVQSVKATNSPRSWIWATIEVEPAWRDAYQDRLRGHLGGFGHDMLDDLDPAPVDPLALAPAF